MNGLFTSILQKGTKLVFLDEAIFSFNTVSTRTWYSTYSSFKIVESNVRIKSQALLSAVSLEKGMEHFMTNPRSICAVQFIAFLEELSQLFGGREFAIFLETL